MTSASSRKIRLALLNHTPTLKQYDLLKVTVLRFTRRTTELPARSRIPLSDDLSPPPLTMITSWEHRKILSFSRKQSSNSLRLHQGMTNDTGNDPWAQLYMFSSLSFKTNRI